MMSLVSVAEVLDVRGSLLHVTETEAILLQLLKQLSLSQAKGLDLLLIDYILCLRIRLHYHIRT